METEEIFAAYGDRVVKIEVTEIGASAKSSLGSAFLVDSTGILITNFHVVSRVVHDPDRFEASWNGDGSTGKIDVLAIDVVHDLALVSAEGDWAVEPLGLVPGEVEQGRRLWSFGYPRDLGKTIVEGTYNGPFERSLARRLNFTGSLNPGMSGGPVVDEAGDVVGVNVAGLGEQLSFLVPVDAAAKLLRVGRDAEFQPRSDLLDDLREQVIAHQAKYFETLFDEGTESVEMGPFRVPSQPRAFFDCAGNVAEPDDERWLEWIQHSCSTEDSLYISGSHWSGMVRFSHLWQDGSAVGRLRFYGPYSNEHGASGWASAEEEDLTNYRCQVTHVELSGLKWNMALCLRAYKDVPGLYDGLVRISSLLDAPEGLQSVLWLGGVTVETVQQVARRFLERIEWTP